jgi:hypothetical protein
MRIKALTSDNSLRKSTPHKLFLGESRKTAFVMIQEGETVKYLRVETEKYLGFEENTLKSAKVFPLKACAQINTD